MLHSHPNAGATELQLHEPTCLLYLLFFYVGLMGLLTAYAHVFRPIQTSASIGWSTSPYEYEVGMADLTVGVLGVLCMKFRGEFWLATAIANAVSLLRDDIGHIRQIDGLQQPGRVA
jgi:hypothetical protein